MREIELTKGYVAKVDDEDYSFLMHWKWYATKRGNIWYAARQIKQTQKTIWMHRVILGLNDDLSILGEHINGDGLDNTRANLRVANKSQNAMNSRLIHADNTSGHKGISWYARDKNWEVHIGFQGRKIHIGRYGTIEEAIAARREAEARYHGEYARQTA